MSTQLLDARVADFVPKIIKYIIKIRFFQPPIRCRSMPSEPFPKKLLGFSHFLAFITKPLLAISCFSVKSHYIFLLLFYRPQKFEYCISGFSLSRIVSQFISSKKFEGFIKYLSSNCTLNAMSFFPRADSILV